ncbi:hypothetical protein PR048_029786 [Dryococelus australis]|uniref:Uncharacterized protein n=1 Tax=Dryococelus australis TaxID=614101 RepID=A0ABQ9G733_9NEOP|nr:hypothetical protein PR048_029786 [Dryococelus australis]
MTMSLSANSGQRYPFPQMPINRFKWNCFLPCRINDGRSREFLMTWMFRINSHALEGDIRIAASERQARRTIDAVKKGKIGWLRAANTSNVPQATLHRRAKIED